MKCLIFTNVSHHISYFGKNIFLFLSKLKAETARVDASLYLSLFVLVFLDAIYDSTNRTKSTGLEPWPRDDIADLPPDQTRTLRNQTWLRRRWLWSLHGHDLEVGTTIELYLVKGYEQSYRHNQMVSCYVYDKTKNWQHMHYCLTVGPWSSLGKVEPLGCQITSPFNNKMGCF